MWTREVVDPISIRRDFFLYFHFFDNEAKRGVKFHHSTAFRRNSLQKSAASGERSILTLGSQVPYSAIQVNLNKKIYLIRKNINYVC